MTRCAPASTVSLRGFLGVLALVVVAASACSGGDSSGPPDISFGRDVCAECHMIISEPRFAAAYRVGSEKPLVFDDIADMVTHANKAGDVDRMKAWVHDYPSEKWMNATDAWYVRSVEIQTPMGGGVVAFRQRDEAEQFKREHDGELLRWKGLVEAVTNAAAAPDTHGTPDTSEAPAQDGGAAGSTTPEQERQVHP